MRKEHEKSSATVRPKALSHMSVEHRYVAPELYPPSAAPTPSSQPSATVAAGKAGQKRAGAIRKKKNPQKCLKRRWYQLAAKEKSLFCLWGSGGVETADSLIEAQRSTLVRLIFAFFLSFPAYFSLHL